MIAFKYTTENSEKVQVKLTFEEKNLSFNGNSYPYSTISFKHNPQSDSVELYLHDATIIECKNNSELEKFIQLNKEKEKFNFLKVVGIKYGVIFPIIILIAALFYESYDQFLPKISKSIAMDIPKENAYKIGKDTLELLDKEYLEPSKLSLERQEALQKKCYKEMKYLKDLPEIKIIFRSSKDLGANALALPNGTVILLDDLVKLSSNDDEVFAIVAHEVGHVYHRHALRQLIQESVLYLGLIFVTGDVTSFATVAGLLPVVLMQQHYSKEFEFEADLYAYDLMKKQKIDPKNFATMLQKIEKSHGKVKSEKYYYLNSHPNTQERIKIFLQ